MTQTPPPSGALRLSEQRLPGRTVAWSTCIVTLGIIGVVVSALELFLIADNFVYFLKSGLLDSDVSLENVAQTATFLLGSGALAFGSRPAAIRRRFGSVSEGSSGVQWNGRDVIIAWVVAGATVATVFAGFTWVGRLTCHGCGDTSVEYAQSSVRNALVAGKAIFTDTDDYSTVDTASMQATEPSLTYVGARESSAFPGEVSVATTGTRAPNDTLLLVALTRSDKCFGVQEVSTEGTTFFSAEDVHGHCAAFDALGATATSW